MEIAAWRNEREQQDMMGLGPEAARRSRRSASGLRELAEFIRALDGDDERIMKLRTLAFSGEMFDPGAGLLNELGRFRFHDEETTLEGFLAFMVELAEEDAVEQGRWGGPQVPGDDPWSPSWIVDLRDEDEDEGEYNG